jgi:hypothetical protein
MALIFGPAATTLFRMLSFNKEVYIKTFEINT